MGVHMVRGGNLTVANVTVEDAGYYGVVVEGSGDVDLRHATLRNGRYAELVILDADRLRVEDSTLEKAPGGGPSYGIGALVTGVDAVEFRRVVVANPGAPWGSGVRILDAGQVTVEESAFHDKGKPVAKGPIRAVLYNFGTDMRLAGPDLRRRISANPNQAGSNDRLGASLEVDDWPMPLIFRVGLSGVNPFVFAPSFVSASMNTPWILPPSDMENVRSVCGNVKGYGTSDGFDFA